MLALLTFLVCISQVVGTAECTIKRKNDYELCDVCTIVNGETMTDENDFKANASGTVTVVVYYGINTLNFVPAGLFNLFRMVNDVVLTKGNFKAISSNTFKNAKMLWFLTITDTKTFDTIAPDAFNDCGRLEYLTISNHSLKVLDFQFAFPKLNQLVISFNPLESVNRQWYQSLPNVSIFFSYNTCVNTTGLGQALLYKIPGEPNFAKCFENFDKLALTTIEVIAPTTEALLTTSEQLPLPVVDCKFQNHRTFGYTCVLSKVITEDFVIGGKHLSGKGNADVTGVIFLRSQLTKIPAIIFKQFSNLQSVDASNSGLAVADSSTLELCGSLKYLDLNDNDIIIINDGFLSSCNSLETIFIENNLINGVSPCSNFMKSQKNLKEVSLAFNICIDDDGYFASDSFNYQQIFVKPLMNCFKNFLDPPLMQVLSRRKLKKGELKPIA